MFADAHHFLLLLLLCFCCRFNDLVFWEKQKPLPSIVSLTGNARRIPRRPSLLSLTQLGRLIAAPTDNVNTHRRRQIIDAGAAAASH